ncbi:hypothetical protein Poli38472_012763 [Pythium oligandrum]|uniref:Uncharacterized protein n=1 Tax=Pythium oligandrum TaxID=41045 RepID=A0A8K1CG68_PYTOL|nr:hypothetical protein Poli38472_012763 [Pythium oligandrum]|eukprot:TMW61572.1 hypothetical protein Poli38472_012763 [Pythium oligandrum]
MVSAEVRRLIQALENVKWEKVQDSLQRHKPVVVCSATAQAWSDFVGCELEPVAPRFLEFEKEKLHISELPASQQHAQMISSPERFTIRQVREWMACDRSTSFPGLLPHTPDLSFGPDALLPFATPSDPRVLYRRDVQTLKVEIGHYQQWGLEAPRLDGKAAEWWRFPCVEYILCDKVNDAMDNCTFKLYDRQSSRDFEFLSSEMPVVEGAILRLNAHRLLAYSPNQELPLGFPDPVVIDLFAVLKHACHALFGHLGLRR